MVTTTTRGSQQTQSTTQQSQTQTQQKQNLQITSGQQTQIQQTTPNTIQNDWFLDEKFFNSFIFKPFGGFNLTDGFFPTLDMGEGSVLGIDPNKRTEFNSLLSYTTFLQNDSEFNTFLANPIAFINSVVSVPISFISEIENSIQGAANCITSGISGIATTGQSLVTSASSSINDALLFIQSNFNTMLTNIGNMFNNIDPVAAGTGDFFTGGGTHFNKDNAFFYYLDRVSDPTGNGKAFGNLKHITNPKGSSIGTAMSHYAEDINKMIFSLFSEVKDFFDEMINRIRTTFNQMNTVVWTNFNNGASGSMQAVTDVLAVPTSMLASFSTFPQCVPTSINVLSSGGQQANSFQIVNRQS